VLQVSVFLSLNKAVNTSMQWQEKREFYMTPQTLQNDLATSTCDPLDIILLVVGPNTYLLISTKFILTDIQTKRIVLLAIMLITRSFAS